MNRSTPTESTERRVVGLLAALLAAFAAAPCPADEDDIAWAGWLVDADVWSLADGPPPTQEPAAFATVAAGAIQAIATPAAAVYPVHQAAPHAASLGPRRVVRYEVPIADRRVHAAIAARGIRGELIALPIKAGANADSTASKYAARVASFFGGAEATPGPDEVLVVRYEAPADDVAFHADFAELQGEIVEPGMLRLPEVRFFQPKARVYMDLKRDNDDEFDLFADGSVLASLDIVELYFPMPLFSERFARTFGRSSRLSGLGWRVGGTVGLGLSTALTNGDAKSNGAPISTLSAGLRYEFPLGRPSQEVLATGDYRLDERTRVGIEGGLQGGLSTEESLDEATDLGLYFGILVNTPWGG